jgi:predicted Zn-dependent protease
VFDTHPDNDRRLQQVLGPARALAAGQQEVNREAFLKRLEGVTFGDSADTGVRRGQRFYHAGLNFTLEFPQGWSLLNRPDALIGHTADQQAFIAMTLEQNPQNLSPTELLHQRIGGQPLVAGIELHQAGLKGYSGLIPGNAPKRVAVIQHGAQDYVFVAAVRGRVSLQSQDELFLNVIKSFRPMTRDDYPQAKPLRLHMVKIKAGQTLEAIAKGSKLPGDALKTLRLLNNLYPSGQPRAGDWLKVVR